MLEISFVVRAGSEQHDVGVVVIRWSQRSKCGSQRRKERSQTFDVALPEFRRQCARQNDAIFQRIARTGRRLRAVAENLKFSICACARYPPNRDAASGLATKSTHGTGAKTRDWPRAIPGEAVRSATVSAGPYRSASNRSSNCARWINPSLSRSHCSDGIRRGIRSRLHGRSRPSGSP